MYGLTNLLLYGIIIGRLMYLAHSTRLDIKFSKNLLARCNFTPIQRHGNEFKHLPSYVQITTCFTLLEKIKISISK